MREHNSPTRLSVEIERELYEKLKKNIPWGSMKHLITAILKDLIKMLEDHDSRLVIAAILSEDLKLRDILDKYEQKPEVEDGEHRQS